MNPQRIRRCALLFFALSTLTAHPLPAEQISYWTLDGHLEDDLADNDGSFHGAGVPLFVEDRDGNPESAIELNGIDEFVEVAQSTSLPLYQHSTFTVAMWVRGGAQNDKRIWSESTTGNRSALYNLGTQNRGQTGQFDLFVRGNPGAGAPANHIWSTAEPFDGTWHHVVFVDDDGTGTLWVDGARDPTTFNYARPAMDLDLTTIGGILRQDADGSESICCLFTGAIDDVRIYDHALTQEEIDELCPPVGCPDEGDTHCDDLLVEGPDDGDPGLYTITALDSVDDSDDVIRYTFTRDNGVARPVSVGPQLENFVDWNLGEGTWTISVTVDDDPLCDDVADDATCSTEIDVVCPEEGDTHCESLGVDGPEDNRPGTYTLTAFASDDSGDLVSYTFTAQRGEEAPLRAGPNETGTASFPLTSGVWTLTVTVDDGAGCGDEADDASCSLEIEIEASEPVLVAHFPLDGDLEDSTGNTEALPFSGLDPAFVEGFDGNPEGAADFNGFDDLLVINLEDTDGGGLQLYGNEAYTVMMWVKGFPQNDFRVFSEASTLTNAPLVNIGTQNRGLTGQVDLYIRPESGPVAINHRWSDREAFDGEWHHIAWVDRGGDAVLYIDGVRDATSFTYTKPPMPTDTTTIGGILRAAPSHWFTGQIDDVRLFNHALGPDEVLAAIPEPEDCDDEGDTHCDDFQVEGPPADGVGDWTFTAFDAGDDSGDEILYLWTVTGEDDFHAQQGPGPVPEATFYLSGGDYTVTLTVDDHLLCRDAADDASCTKDISVAPPPEILVSHWELDGDLLDSQPSGNHGEFLGGEPVFVVDRDDNEESALSFDGIDDVVRAETVDGLPVYNNPAYSISMWVRGDGSVGAPNADDRVWSESTDTSNAPLFNIGTHVGGTGPQVDIYIRTLGGQAPVSHRLSTGAAFDGTWHHIAWVDESGDAALYIDGVRDATDFSYAKPTAAQMPLSITTIGGILRGNTCCLFTGDIDDVCAFSYALDDADVLSIYENGCVGGEVPEEEDCDVEGDEDGNGLADCDDPVCAPLKGCQPDTEAFVRGDTNSSGVIDLTDGVVTLNFLFTGGPPPACMDAADTDNNGALVISDAVVVFSYLFTGGPPPRARAPSETTYTTDDCGPDAEGDVDGLDCATLANTCVP